MNLVRLGGYVLETGAGRKMGCEEKRGVKDEDSKVLGLNNWVPTEKTDLGERDSRSVLDILNMKWSLHSQWLH